MTDTLSPPPLPVCFMLDELATLGHLQAVENAVGLAAGYGIQLFTVFQDVAQMRDLYKGRWASFIGNAGVRALFNLYDYDTAKYWSNFMGGHLVETTSQSQDVHGLAQGQSKGETIRPLMSPEEIMLQFAKGEMLVLPQGSHPIRTKRVPYWKDATLAGLWDDPRLPLPPKPAAPKPADTPQAPASPPLSAAQVAETVRSVWFKTGAGASFVRDLGERGLRVGRTETGYVIRTKEGSAHPLDQAAYGWIATMMCAALDKLVEELENQPGKTR